jgi:hypothetical protein
MVDFDAEVAESDDDDCNYELKRSPHLLDIRKQAVECLESFFFDKKYWAGGKISKQKLYSEEHILTVMETNLVDGLDVAYLCLETQKPQNFKFKGDTKKWEVELCYGVLKACPNRMIPKCFVGGILLVYLAVCQGVNYLDKLKEVNSTLKGNFSNTI